MFVALRAEGFEALSIAELMPSVSDAEVMALAREQRAVVLTMDSDFGEMIFKAGDAAPLGIVFVRTKQFPLPLAITQVVAIFQTADLIGHFITVSRVGQRSTPMPKRSATDA